MRKFKIERNPINNKEFRIRITAIGKTKIIYPFKSEKQAKKYWKAQEELDKMHQFLGQ